MQVRYFSFFAFFRLVLLLIVLKIFTNLSRNRKFPLSTLPKKAKMDVMTWFLFLILPMTFFGDVIPDLPSELDPSFEALFEI